MITDRFGISEYPFYGVFYSIQQDDSKPLDEQTEEEVEIFSTHLDLAEGNALSNDTFKIFFPFDSYNEEIKISVGNLFKGNFDGSVLEGRVISIYPSQLGGCMVLLRMI